MVDYGNALDQELRLGEADVWMGPEGETWKSLKVASTTEPRPDPIEIQIAERRESGTIDNIAATHAWCRRVDRSIRNSETKDIVIYVHGAKVGFLHSCAFAAELDHFAGRDLTPIAFDWPTHQQIFSYIDRDDLGHAFRSAGKLADLVRLLSSQTSVRKIHVVSWSAGARVVSRAMVDLAEGRPDDLRKKYRLGALVFAAGDVSEKDFVKRLPSIHGLADRVIVYISDDDFALKWSSRVMGGGRRLGLATKKLTTEERTILHTMKRLEVIDTSYGKEVRGFDITGHRYWFQHPWVNSDLLLAIRTDAPARQRGLKPAPLGGVYYFGKAYSEQISTYGRALTTGQW
jgi:esterase/lipase superfamily enzyme